MTQVTAANLSNLQPATLVNVRPEARQGVVDIGERELPFHINVVVRKGPGRKPIGFATGTEISQYITKHHIRKVQVAFDAATRRILAVVLP